MKVTDSRHVEGIEDATFHAEAERLARLLPRVFPGRPLRYRVLLLQRAAVVLEDERRRQEGSRGRPRGVRPGSKLVDGHFVPPEDDADE